MSDAAFKLTGWHVLAMFCSAFGVIISVNVVLAVNAVRSFPGLEVKNSYVASQSFDARRATQETLGWTVQAQAQPGQLILSIRDTQGRPVQAGRVTAILGRATHMRDDRLPDFRYDGRNYVADETLVPGNWNIRMTAQALDGSLFEQRIVLHVKG